MRSLLDLPPEYIREEWKTCAVPGRPWWTTATHDLDVGSYYHRRDGAEIVPFLDGHWRSVTLDLCIAYDTEHPLLRPPTRCGQIWAEQNAAGNWRIAAIGERCVGGLGFALHTGDSFGTTAWLLLHDPLFPKSAPWSSV